MKISLVTICFNSAATIEDTILSVLGQKHKDIEYIIKDGGSTDGTIDILKKYEDKITWVSKPDQGIYSAMNQGLELVTGEVVGLLNSDDFYADEEVLTRVVKIFEDPTIGAAYGDLQYVEYDDTSKVTRNWEAGEFKREYFLKGWMPPHPTFFIRKEYYDKYGLFNPDFVSAGDYELMLRMLYKHQINTAYIPAVQIKMRAGGISNTSLKNRIRANKEDRRAWRINGLKPKWYTLWWKPLSKLVQWI
ncbi:glycosyltransferase family 2 protein [Jiulongibacter sp. NS-SX5]|uniref:glycosyltransferase family 2 protein n=1 Tax=Jiulongibacter sp. NS-SX5 TaxID=3463854 RepID=UPI0040593E9B